MDFEGSGLSSGEFVSLGHFEKTQVSLVIDFITDRYHVGTIGLWGRSMGAVTAILYAEENPSRVSVLIADSPFSSIKKMVQDIAFEHYKIPSFVVNIGLSIISSSIEERIRVDLFAVLDPYLNCANCMSPVMFIAASSDGLVQPKRVNQMFKNYGTNRSAGIRKHYLECSGNHTDQREEGLIQTCFSFVQNEFDLYTEAKKKLDLHVFNMGRYVRVKGVNNARSSKKIMPVDKKGNLKMASKLSTTRLRVSGISLSSSRSGTNLTTAAALRESTNMQEYKDKISGGVNMLRPNLPKSNYNKFKELNKENPRKVSPRVPNKVLESEVEVRAVQKRQDEPCQTSAIVYSASTRPPAITDRCPPPLLGMKHSRTRSMTGLLPFGGQSSPAVCAPSFLGHAAHLGNYSSQPRTMSSRHNSFSNLLQDCDLNQSTQYPAPGNTSGSRQQTPIKSKAVDKESSTSNIQLYSSTSRSVKRLEEVCQSKASAFNANYNLVQIKSPSFHEEVTTTSTPNDSRAYRRSDWFQFGFSNKPSYLNDSLADDAKRAETFAKERYGAY
jgi:hypothetical protein